jgi:hypothetical protein
LFLFFVFCFLFFCFQKSFSKKILLSAIFCCLFFYTWAWAYWAWICVVILKRKLPRPLFFFSERSLPLVPWISVVVLYIRIIQGPFKFWREYFCMGGGWRVEWILRSSINIYMLIYTAFFFLSLTFTVCLILQCAYISPKGTNSVFLINRYICISGVWVFVNSVWCLGICK